MKNQDLVAVCGLYCGACSIYRATQDGNEEKLKDFAQGLSARTGKNFTVDDVLCDGCLTRGRLDLWCRNCQIRICPELKAGRVRCSDCEELPCSRLTSFQNDGMKHHLEIVDNLKNLQEAGIERWAAQEEKRWTCPLCNASLAWYDAACPGCQTPRPDELFKL